MRPSKRVPNVRRGISTTSWEFIRGVRKRIKELRDFSIGVTMIKSQKEIPFRDSEDELKGKAVLFSCWRKVEAVLEISAEGSGEGENPYGRMVVAGIVKDIDLVKHVAVIRIIGGEVHQRYLRKEREIFFSSFRKLTEEETLAYSI